MSLTVLQIIPNLGAGGAEQACVDIAAALVRRGDRALVVSSGGRRVVEVKEGGAEHIEIEASSKNPLKILRNARFLAELIRREKVDIIHARSRAPAWSAYLAARKTGCRYVTTFHAVYKFKSRAKKLYNSVMSKGERVIAISEFVAKHILENYKTPPENIVVIPRGVNLDKFAPDKIDVNRREVMRQSWEIPQEQKIILLPARLSAIKGQALAIEAMAALPEKEKAVLVIVGDDQGRAGYRQSLEDLVAAKNLSASVRFVPHCSDMPTAYALSDLVLVPSRVPEGFGRVPVEAMALGVPVIASDLGATTETVLEGETGWLLAPDDPAKWSVAMQNALALSSEDKQKMAAKGIARVRELFDYQKMIASTLAVYDDLMKAKR